MLAAFRVSCLILALSTLGGRAALAARATAAAVQADPYWSAWTAAVDAAPGGPATEACATSDALDAALVRRHAAREALLQSLARRGIDPAPPPPGVAPWPWSPAAGALDPVAHFDTADVAVLVDDGLMVFVNRVGQPEIDPVYASRAFYARHDDEYDFLVLFTNFYTQLANGSFDAYHQAVSNDVLGIGYAYARDSETFSQTTEFTHKPTSGRLQSFVHMNGIYRYPDDPWAVHRRSFSPVSLLGHEVGHRWLARARLKQTPGPATNHLLGRQLAHWSFFFNSNGSAVEGNAWAEDGERFGTLDLQPLGYGPLDLYLMGMQGADEVPSDAIWYIAEPHDLSPEIDPETGWYFDVSSPPTPGVSCSGQRVDVTMSDIVWANGPRVPAYPAAPRDFRLAFALVVRDAGTLQQVELDRIAALQAAFRDYFHTQTRGRGRVDTTLHRVPGALLFEHRPLGDVEDPSSPIPVRVQVSIGPGSLPVRPEDVSASLHWSANGGAFAVIAMQPEAPGVFTGAIPPQALGSTVRYWLEARTDLPDHVARWPAGAPDAAFEFVVVSDREPPTIQHAARRRHARHAEPILLRALVQDDHGVEAVHVEYGLGDPPAELQVQAMARQGLSDVYETRLELPGRIGDVVAYRIAAQDVATAPHRSVQPAAGFHRIEITRAQIEDVEDEDPMWTHRSLSFEGPDQWHREIVNPHSGSYCWKIGPTHNTAPGIIAPLQHAVLEGPAVRVGPGGALRIWHRFSFLLEQQAPSLYAIDGGLVEWQDVHRDGPIGKWWLLDPDRGYTHVISHESDGAFGMNYPVLSGNQLAWEQDVFTFPRQAINRTLRLRFRVATSSPQYRRPAKDGWVIDDIEIDPGDAIVPVAVEGLQAERTPDGVRLAWTAREAAGGDVFRVDRADLDDASEHFAGVGTVDAVPGTADYSFVDASAHGERGYAYRLMLVSDGVAIPTQEVHVPGARRFVLHPNVPNPFNPSTRLAFEIDRTAWTRLAVFDVRGRLVRVLVDGPRAAGPHAVVWDGTDHDRRRLASGVYLARLTSGDRSLVRRMVLLQ